MMAALFLHTVALLGVFAGAICLYGGTSRQNLFPHRLPATWSVAGVVVSFLVGAAALQRLMGPAAAFFTELVLVMATLVALPAVSVLRKGDGR
jgi:hypothetical protein